jgi:Spy/CpxP family protein refolding chaperone
MNKKVIIFLVFLCALSLSLGAVVLFSRRARNQERQLTEGFGRDALGLSPAQKRDLDKLQQTMQENMKPLQNDARRARLELMALLQKPEPDSKAIREKLSEISRLQSEMQSIAVENLLNMKKILTLEQQKRLFETLCIGICPGGHGGRSCERDSSTAGKN